MSAGCGASTAPSAEPPSSCHGPAGVKPTTTMALTRGDDGDKETWKQPKEERRDRKQPQGPFAQAQFP